MKIPTITLILIFLFCTNLFFLRPISAQGTVEKDTLQFLNTRVLPVSGNYIVIKDANVRDRPATKGRRVGRRARGEQVIVVGRAKGPWLAIRNKDGKDIGFIYQRILIQIIDGELKNPLNGTVLTGTSQKCKYAIKFVGKSPAEGQVFKFSDYQISWICDLVGQSLKFNTPMFLSEGPYSETSENIHQITIDTLGLTHNIESALSTHLIWDRKKQLVKFDSITVKKFGQNPPLNNIRAETTIDALNAAAKIAASVWSKSFWKVVGNRQPSNQD